MELAVRKHGEAARLQAGLLSLAAPQTWLTGDGRPIRVWTPITTQ